MTRRSPSERLSRTVILVIAAGLTAACAGVGCRPRTPPPGGPNTPKAQDARKKAEKVVVDAVAGGARAVAQANPSRGGLLGHLAGAPIPVPTPVVVAAPVPPAPSPAATTDPTPPPAATVSIGPPPPGRVVYRERVTSGSAFPTEAQATTEALKAAQTLIAARLEQLTPPLRYVPSLETIRTQFTRQKVVRRPEPYEREGLDGHTRPDAQVVVEYDVEMTDEQIRDLRTRDRLTTGLRVFGMIAGAALAGFLFLRLDEWSKGYLTSWLAVAAAALAGGVAVALLLV